MEPKIVIKFICGGVDGSGGGGDGSGGEGNGSGGGGDGSGGGGDGSVCGGDGSGGGGDETAVLFDMGVEGVLGENVHHPGGLPKVGERSPLSIAERSHSPEMFTAHVGTW